MMSESTRGVLLGAFIPKELATQFEHLARDNHEPIAAAVKHAIELYVASWIDEKAAA